MDFLTTIILATLLGLIPAFIARSKGSSFLGFWLFGAFFFIAALPVSIFMKRELPPEMMECPACKNPVSRDAISCPKCGKPIAAPTPALA